MAPPVRQSTATATATTTKKASFAGTVTAAVTAAVAQKANAAKTMLRSVFIDDGLPVPLNMSRLTFTISNLRHPSSPIEDTIDTIMSGVYESSKTKAIGLVDKMLRECADNIVGIQRIMRHIETIWYTEKYENVLISFISLAKKSELKNNSGILNVVAPILGGDALILRAIQMCRWIDALNERIKTSGTIVISRRQVILGEELNALTSGLNIVKSLCIQLAKKHAELGCQTFDGANPLKSDDISWSQGIDEIPEEGTPAQQPMTSSIGSASGGMLGKQSPAPDSIVDNGNVKKAIL